MKTIQQSKLKKQLKFAARCPVWTSLSANDDGPKRLSTATGHRPVTARWTSKSSSALVRTQEQRLSSTENDAAVYDPISARTARELWRRNHPGFGPDNGATLHYCGRIV